MNSTFVWTPENIEKFLHLNQKFYIKKRKLKIKKIDKSMIDIIKTAYTE